MAAANKFAYGTKLHKKLIEEILARFRLSQRYMSPRYAGWAKQEKSFEAYIKETDIDAARRAGRDNGKPAHTTFVVPYSYSMLMAAHTYWTSVFLARDPVFQYMARHAKSGQGTLQVEALMQYQMQVGQMMGPLFCWLMDVGKYGLGVVGSYWEEEQRTVSQIIEVPTYYMGIMPTGKTKKVRRMQKINGYMGNKLFNVRPYDFFPDPRVPLTQLQSGEFVGRLTDVGWNTVKRREEQGRYFNVSQLAQSRNAKSHLRSGDGFGDLPAGQDSSGFFTGGEAPSRVNLDTVELLELTVELSPRDWGVGNSTSLEKWVFTVGNGGVLIGAEPLGRYHDQFEFHALEYEIDAYHLHKRGVMEVVEPMQDALTWLVNAHFTNVQKAVNDSLIVDPSAVVMKDLMKPKGGRLVRLKPDFYGRKPGDHVHQLQIADVTQNNMYDARELATYMQRALGTNDNVMGMMSQGGRKTATEVRSSSSFSINRLKTNAEYFSAMGFAPLSQTLLQTTQQYYDGQMEMNVAGPASGQVGSVNVSPEGIAGFYDFVQVDGTLPVDRYAQANLWMQMLAQMQTNPQLANSYNMGGIFEWVAQLSGLKSIRQFRIETLPDDQLVQEEQKGNVVGGQQGFDAAFGEADTGGGEGRVAEPNQIPGMGATG